MTIEQVRSELRREFLSLLSTGQYRFLRLLMKRARQLRFTGPAPNSFRIGERYLDDQVLIPCTIRAVFNSPSFLKTDSFFHNKHPVSIYQRGPVMTVRVDRPISSRLWDDLRLLDDGHQFFVGYMDALLPVVNRRLLDSRYFSGHILGRTYSVYDALGIVVTRGDVNLHVNWPRGTMPFPKSAELAPQATDIYLRDYIDAIHAFMKNDFDDCIRRVITSIENFSEHLTWTATPRTFRNVLATNAEKTTYGHVIVDNLVFVYSVRNRIVHSGFRTSTRGRVFCHKAIESLRHLIQRHCGSPAIGRYAYSLAQQTLMLTESVSRFDLDALKRLYALPEPLIPTVTNWVQFENSVFNGLRLTEKDKLSILSQRHLLRRLLTLFTGST